METLYNGIQLPEIWPPRNLGAGSDEPIVVPYLENLPMAFIGAHRLKPIN